MAKRKCPFCGCSDFVQIRLVTVSGVDIDQSENVVSMACIKCGHVDIVAKPEVIQKELDLINAQKKKEEEIKHLKEQIKSIKEEITNVKKIINDENQTVKTVNDAKKRLEVLEIELRSAQDRLDSYNYSWSYW